MRNMLSNIHEKLRFRRLDEGGESFARKCQGSMLTVTTNDRNHPQGLDFVWRHPDCIESRRSSWWDVHWERWSMLSSRDHCHIHRWPPRWDRGNMNVAHRRSWRQSNTNEETRKSDYEAVTSAWKRTRLTMGWKKNFAWEDMDRRMKRTVRDQHSLSLADERYRTMIGSSKGNNWKNFKRITTSQSNSSSRLFLLVEQCLYTDGSLRDSLWNRDFCVSTKEQERSTRWSALPQTWI